MTNLLRYRARRAALWETTLASPAKAVVWPTSDVIVRCSESSIDALAATRRSSRSTTDARARSEQRWVLVAVGTESATIQFARLR